MQKLQRVFSRTQLPVAPAVVAHEITNEIFNEKFEYTIQPEDIQLDSTQQGSEDEVTTTSIMLMGDGDQEKLGSFSHRTVLAANPRKDSYTSVREDSSLAQSFTTRRLDSEVKPNIHLDRLRLQNQQAATLSLDESAVIDDNSSTESFPSRPRANLDTLPEEILDLIFSLVTIDASKDRFVNPRVDVFSLLFVCKAVSGAALRVLYHHCKFVQTRAFSKFVGSLTEDPRLGRLVQCLDFAHYNPVGYGRSHNERIGNTYLTAQSLSTCLAQTSGLQAFLAHGKIDEELDTTVLSTLIRQPSLRALDLCACASDKFKSAFVNTCAEIAELDYGSGLEGRFVSSIERLSLHSCATLPSQIFEDLLPRLPRVTHLDLAYTKVTDEALMSIPHTARITHLNLSRCTQVTGAGVAEFLTTHPAVQSSLVYLNLMADPSRYRLLDERDLTELLPALPSCLRALNVGGAKITRTHVPVLRQLATHLQELGLRGADLNLGDDIAAILSMPHQIRQQQRQGSTTAVARSSLLYIDLADVKSINKMSLLYSPNAIVGQETLPLEVIELSDGVREDVDKSIRRQRTAEWVTRESKRRGWLVRQTWPTSATADDGHRAWKMGARWWGMRKIPVWEQEVGGMYGHFMFAC